MNSSLWKIFIHLDKGKGHKLYATDSMLCPYKNLYSIIFSNVKKGK